MKVRYITSVIIFSLIISQQSVFSATLSKSERMAIQSRLTELQQLLAQKTTAPSPSDTLRTYRFERALTLGSTGDDVLQLQRFLNQTASTQVARTGAGSPGNETRYYGQATKQAVATFQTQQGIVASGEFTHETRIVVNGKLSRIVVTPLQPVDPTTLPLLPEVGLTPEQIPVFSTQAAREQNVFQGNPSNDQKYLKEESARIAKVFGVPASQVGGQSYSNSGTSASSTPGWDNVKNIATAVVGAIFVRNFSGSIVRPPHFCTCTLTPLIFISDPEMKVGFKTLALYPVPGKTLFMSYNFFTPKVAVLGQYANLYVKAPCLQGFPPACTPDPTIKNIDGFVIRMGTSLLPVRDSGYSSVGDAASALLGK